MSTVSSATSASNVRGYGGLASGLDRDSLIEGMTIGTKTKIEQQEQKKQLLEWKQEAYRSVSSSMISFSDKYTSYTSSTNLSSVSLFSRSDITSTGANSKYIDVSGSISGAASFSITGVKQIAVDASATSKTAVSDQLLETGLISTDITQMQDISNLEGKSIAIKHGNDSYNVVLQTGTSSDGFTFDYSTMEKAAESINKSLENVKISGDKTMAEVLDVNVTGGKFTFVSKDTAGNTLKITGGSEDVLQSLGILGSDESIASLSADRTVITSEGLTGIEDATLTHGETFAERIAGKSISFTYNGVTKKITLPLAGEITSLADVQEGLQAGLNDAFGTGRVKVSLNIDDLDPSKAAFGFETTTPDGSKDASSVLAISVGDKGLLGTNGAFGVVAGESNRLNTSAALADAGLARYAGVNPEDPMELSINGITIEGLTYSSTISDIMKKINETEGVNVEVSYMHNADKFVLKSTEAGASGGVVLEGMGADILFGVEGTDYRTVVGQDAIVSVKYAGSDETMDVIRGSNAFKLDGLNITVKNKFGYDETVVDGSITYIEKADNEAVVFTATVDTDKITSAIKDMVKDYNEMLELVNKEVSTKKNRSYAPLTDAQKEEMSEDQITAWEEKAKAGMLFNDSVMRGIADDFRFVLSVGSAGKQALEAMGISISTNYADNGKLVLDETALKATLDSDPEAVKDAFTRTADESTGDKGGLMARMTSTLNKYAKTTGANKGTLIARAGSTSVPTSILSNTILKEMNSIDDYIERLQETLKSQTDRYVKQFTNLETLISQMNSQSEWLASAFSY